MKLNCIETFESVNKREKGGGVGLWRVKANVKDCPYMGKKASCKLIFICKCLPLFPLFPSAKIQTLTSKRW